MAKIERALPPYEQVAQHLRDRIKRKQLTPGDLIPSEREIAEEWGISRATATKAVATLRSQGLVESITGVGTKVVETQVVAPEIVTRSPRERYVHVDRRGRMRAEGEDVEIRTSPADRAPDNVYAALGMEAGGKVIKRSRITRVEGIIVELSTSWFDHTIADDCELLLEKAPIEGGTTTYVAKRLGFHFISVFDDVTSELADVNRAKQFGVQLPAALLVTRTTVIDETYGPFAFEVYRHRPGHHAQYTYDL
jgi:DNA-binding GntR family transcriptional regulator